MIKVNKLSIKFTKEFFALNDISLEVKKGEKVCLIGEHNSGKTTFLRTLAGLQPFDSGEIYLKNIEIRKIDFKTDVSLGYIPSTPIFDYKKNVYENVKLFIQTKNVSKYKVHEEILDKLAEFKLDRMVNWPISKLSMYQKFMLSLLRLSFRSLDILLIDNIFEDLTEQEIEEITRILKSYFLDKQITILFVKSKNKRLNEMVTREIKFESGSVKNE